VLAVAVCAPVALPRVQFDSANPLALVILGVRVEHGCRLIGRNRADLRDRRRRGGQGVSPGVVPGFQLVAVARPEASVFTVCEAPPLTRFLPPVFPP
jgi:hypothetical protein